MAKPILERLFEVVYGEKIDLARHGKGFLKELCDYALKLGSYPVFPPSERVVDLTAGASYELGNKKWEEFFRENKVKLKPAGGGKAFRIDLLYPLPIVITAGFYYYHYFLSMFKTSLTLFPTLLAVFRPHSSISKESSTCFAVAAPPKWAVGSESATKIIP